MKRFIVETVKSILKKSTLLPVGSGSSLDPLIGQLASDAIKQELTANKPSFVARFGWTEIDAIIAYTDGIEKDVRFGKLVRFLIKQFVNNPLLLKEASGFYSNDVESVKRFCQYHIDIMDDIDICVNWMKQERFVEKYLGNTIWISQGSLFDPFVKAPWTAILKGKKVLVINPFVKSIEHQYKKREKLFDNKTYLPEFQLETYKPVLGNCGSKFRTWWDALDFMKKEISKKDCDIALLSCGAFGHPLCAHIKSMGKKAIYMGGDLQIMFGIYGDRWIGNPIINEHWIRPLKEDLPQDASFSSYKALHNYI